MNKPKRYGNRGTIRRDKSDDTIANPNKNEIRTRNKALWGTEHPMESIINLSKSAVDLWNHNVIRGNKFWGYNQGNKEK